MSTTRIWKLFLILSLLVLVSCTTSQNQPTVVPVSSVDDLSGSCQELSNFSEGKIIRHEEIVLYVGTDHGILYKPLDEWILPAVQWANQ